MKMFFTAAAMFMMSGLMAQGLKKSSGSRTSFGIEAGFDMRNLYGKNANGSDLDTKLAPKFHVGVNAAIPVSKDLRFQPGLNFAAKGFKNESTFSGVNYTQKANLYYLDLPMNFVYHPMLGNGHLLLGGGPYIGFGIGGKVKTTSGSLNNTSDVEYRNTVKLNDPQDREYFKRMDAGVGLLAGYEWRSGLSFQLNTNLGLMNIEPDYEGSSNSQFKAKHIGFGLSVGYRFGK